MILSNVRSSYGSALKTQRGIVFKIATTIGENVVLQYGKDHFHMETIFDKCLYG